MKKLYKLVLKAFLGPFILTFFISIFILLMQFLWKYIDDLVGKGLDIFTIGQLLFYASASLVPMALPLAMLLSSIMTFGNLSEHYELVALKSAGISLRKIMMPVILAGVIISVGAFFFSNHALPYSNLKMGSLLWDIRNADPAFNLKPGVFDNSIQNFSIRVDNKDEDQNLEGVMIYNHLERNGNSEVILAEGGKMDMADGGKTLVLYLKNGSSYNEPQKSRKDRTNFPLYRTTFNEKTIRFDLSNLGLSRTDEDLFKHNYHMLNLKQLEKQKDSLVKLYNNNTSAYYSQLKNQIQVDSSLANIDSKFSTKEFLKSFEKNEQKFIINSAMALTRDQINLSTRNTENFGHDMAIIRKHDIEWHRKYTLSFACMVLLFVGAPLGALIKKGGLGMPMVVSVGLFLVYHVVSISGEKAAKVGEMTVYKGMWLASACFLPVGIYLTYRAAKDKAIISSNWISSLYSIFKK